MLAGIFEEDKFHSIFPPGSTKLGVIVILLLILVNLVYELVLIKDLLVMPGLLVLATPEVTEDDIPA